MNYIFIGSTKFSLNVLKEIINSKYKPKAIISEFKKSKLNSDYNNLSSQRKLIDHYLLTKNINNKTSIKFIKNLKPNFLIVVGFNTIISKEILDIPVNGAIGFHPTDLPKNRGNNPIIWSIICKKKKLYSTFFKMGLGIDDGRVLKKTSINISKDSTSTNLYKMLSKETSRNLKKILLEKKYEKKYLIQKDKRKSYWRKRNFFDGVVDWRMSSDIISRYIRALLPPYPYASFKFKKKYIRIKNYKLMKNISSNNYEPGKIIKFIDNNNFIVKTDDYCIKITTLDRINLKKTRYL